MPAEARKYVGVPWRHQGRNPEVGLDCVGIVALYLAHRGIRVRDRKDYGRDPDGSLWAEIVRCLGEPVSRRAEDARPGDVVVMDFANGAPRHVGIVSEFQGVPHLIHADNSPTVRKVVEVPIDRRWARRITGVWRVPG